MSFPSSSSMKRSISPFSSFSTCSSSKFACFDSDHASSASSSSSKRFTWLSLSLAKDNFSSSSPPSSTAAASVGENSTSISNSSHIDRSSKFASAVSEFDGKVQLIRSSASDWSLVVMDCICLIFSNLNVLDLLSCRRVCLSWNRSSHSSISWQSSDYSIDFQDVGNVNQLVSLMKSIRFVRSLRMKGCGENQSHFFRSCFDPSLLSHLTAMDLSDLRFQHFPLPAGVISFLSTLPSLRKLKLFRDVEIPSSDFNFLPLTLTDLDWSVSESGWSRIGKLSLIQLTIKSRSLQSLVQLSTSHCASTLQHLTFKQSLPSSDFSNPISVAALLPRFPSLTTLNLVDSWASYTTWLDMMKTIRIRNELNPTRPFHFQHGGLVNLIRMNEPRWFGHSCFFRMFCIESAREYLGISPPSNESTRRDNIIWSALISPHWIPCYEVMMKMLTRNSSAIGWDFSGLEFGIAIRCPICEEECPIDFHYNHSSLCNRIYT